MTPVAFALLSLLCWSVGDIFGTVASRRLGALATSVWGYVLRIAVFAIYIPFGLEELKHYNPQLLALNLILGVVLAAGFLCFNRGLKVGNPSIVGTIAAAYTAIVVVLSIVFLNESLVAKEALAILAIFGGVLLVSLDKEALSYKSLFNSGTTLALFAMLFWGIYFTFVKILVKEVGWFWPNYISFSLVFFVLPAIKVANIKLKSINYNKGLFPLLSAAILTGVAEFSFNYAVSEGNSSVVAPIAGAYPVLFVVLASLIFREPIKTRQVFGVIVSLFGLIALSVISISHS